jgi:hypothetical protein
MLLETEPGFRVVGKARNGEEAMRLVREVEKPRSNANYRNSLLQYRKVFFFSEHLGARV